MRMRFWSNLRLMLTVAKRELTSILRGKAERFLFIWTSMLALPLITLAVLTLFLMLRTTDILSPARVGVARSAAGSAQGARMIADLHRAPDVIVEVMDDPSAALRTNKCDAVLEPDFSQNTLRLTSNNIIIERIVSRALENARREQMATVVPSDRDGADGARASSVFAYSVHLESLYRYTAMHSGMQTLVAALYCVAFLYASVWLIPAIDVVRFDFLHNNIYANLSLPVPMNVVTGGKLISGIAITLLPTVLSGIAFAFSATLASVVFIDYYAGGTAGGVMTVQDIFGTSAIPFMELVLLPWILVLAVAFLHSWLMMVVVFLQGQRLSFSASLFSLLMWVQFAVMFGMLVPPNALWADAVPFFGLAACVKQMTYGHLSFLGLLLASVSSLLVTALFVARAGAFYSLEPWAARVRANARRGAVAK